MDTRICARCGKVFEPPREHSRFCSALCRVAWNRENLTPDRWGAGSWDPDKQLDPQTQASALEWSVLGMRDTAERLGRVRPADCSQAFAVIGEAVWWVTIVDATMVRYHPLEYEAQLSALPAGERERTEGTFGGLRFVRNRMGYHADHSEFISLGPAGLSSPGLGPARLSTSGLGPAGLSTSGLGPAGLSTSGLGSPGRRSPGGRLDAPITQWTWKSLSEPELDALGPRGETWERKRYRAYQSWLAERTMGETFQRASGFLALAAVRAGCSGGGLAVC